MTFDLAEDAFQDANLDGINLKVLRSDLHGTVGTTLAQWVKNAVEAIERKYLRSLTLAFFEEEGKPEKAFELYTFNFGYLDPENDPSGQPTVSMSLSKGTGAPGSGPRPLTSAEKNVLYGEVKRSIRRLLMITEGLDSLPEQTRFTLKLEYTDDTPDDYEPSGFEPAAFAFELDETAEGKEMTLTAGKVTTRHHRLEAEVKSRLANPSEALENGADEEIVEAMRDSQKVARGNAFCSDDVVKKGHFCFQASETMSQSTQDQVVRGDGDGTVGEAGGQKRSPCKRDADSTQSKYNKRKKY